MRIIIAVECKGDRPEIELSNVLNEIAEKATEEDLAVGERLLKGMKGDVVGKMFVEDTEGFLSDEGYKMLVNAIGQRQKRSDAS